MGNDGWLRSLPDTSRHALCCGSTSGGQGGFSVLGGGQPIFDENGGFGGDGVADIITGAGAGGDPHVKAFSFPALDLLFEFYSGDPANTGGVFVS